MIALAFAQMLYYLVNSIKAYGGGEELSIKLRSDFGLRIELKNDLHFYLLVLLCLGLSLGLIQTLTRSWLGRIVLAQRDDKVRTQPWATRLIVAS